MIQLEEIRKVYRTEDIETTALNSINLQVEEGDFTAVMGPSGCGKSTLLNVLGMLDVPSSGSYRFDGQEVVGLKERNRAKIRKAKIGFVFQSFNLIDELTVFENIELPLIYLKLSAGQRKEKVRQVMERMQIAHRFRHFPQQLSGGQQQRVAICRAIVTNPRLILADEPTGNLDSRNGEEVMRLLIELNEEGTTVFMVTHSREHALKAKRIINFLDGEILSEEFAQLNTDELSL